MANQKNIISASRRTDIPRYYSKWFSSRRKEGRAEFRNTFGGKGAVSLKDEDVLGYLFWTRYAKPLSPEISSLLQNGIPCVFQFTITDYGRWLEPHALPLSKVIKNFLECSNMLPGPECIQWRYDPVIVCDQQSVSWHVQNFREIATALKGATQVVNISFVEPYVKTIRRINNSTTAYRGVDTTRHRSVLKRYPNLKQIDDATGRTIVEELSSIAQENGMELRMCANPEWSAIKSQCCSLDLFSPYDNTVSEQIKSLKHGPSRSSCNCIKTVDIGMDNTCINGCKYCYVVTSHELAVKNNRRHFSNGLMLR